MTAYIVGFVALLIGACTGQLIAMVIRRPGWLCPRCGKVYAPHVAECKACNEEARP